MAGKYAGKLIFGVSKGATKVEISDGLRSVLNQIEKTNAVKIKLRLDIDKSSIKSVQKQIASIQSQIKPVKVAAQSTKSNGLNKSNNNIASSNTNTLNTIKAENNALNQAYSALTKIYNLRENFNIKQSDSDAQSAINEIQKIEDGIQSLISQFKNGSIGIDEFRNKLEQAKSGMSEYSYILNTSGNISVGSKQQLDMLSTIDNAIARNKSHLESWTKAQNGSSSADYKILQEQNAAYEELFKKVSDGAISLREAKKEYSEISSKISSANEKIKASGEDTLSFFDRIKEGVKKFGSWLSVSQIVMQSIRSIKKMISAVAELDYAMTQLKVVTNETEAAYSKYSKTIAQTASEIGASVVDLIDSTTVYARLGYSLDESTTLAKYTAMLQNVGDIDVESAQNAITAITKAYDDIDINNIESMMDKLVKTGRHNCPTA